MRLVQLGHGHVFVQLLKGARVVKPLHTLRIEGIGFARGVGHGALSDLNVRSRLNELAWICITRLRRRGIRVPVQHPLVGFQGLQHG